MTGYSRRSLLKLASGMALASLARPALATPPWIAEKPKFIADPFTLGVASGDPNPGGAVLWTRLAPDPFDAMGAGGDPIPVRYEVAADDRFREVVKTGATIAYPENSHAVHIDVSGLGAGRPYYYRFMAGDAVSPVGRLKTAPAVMAPVDQFKMAFASCQQYEMGYFKAYRDMVALDPDLVLHLGDYIYESTWNGPLRRVPVAEARTLDDYRRLHAAYKLDEDLQAAHRHTSWMFTWDDHEVVNDYAADQDEDYEAPETFLLRRAAAYKAYYEHLPLRASAKPYGPNMHLHQRQFFGDMLEVNMLDTRQYRTDHPCQTPSEGGWQRISGQCRERFDPNRTILGEGQERWFLGRLARQGCRWNIMAQGMLFSQHDFRVGEGEEIGSEYWDGYVASRRRVLDTVKKRDIKNFVVVGGDVHASYVCDVKEDYANPGSATLGAEFVTTSVTSPNGRHEQNQLTLPDNPHIHKYDARYRGYTLMTMDKDKMLTELRVVDDVMTKADDARLNKAYIVENGVPGVQDA